MTQDLTNPSSKHFDFEAFQSKAVEQLRNGASLTGTEGIFTPLLGNFHPFAQENHGSVSG